MRSSCLLSITSWKCANSYSCDTSGARDLKSKVRTKLRLDRILSLIQLLT